MFLKPFFTASLESILNTFLYRPPALKIARQRINGKVLRISLKESFASLVLVFSEAQLDVLGEWEGETDCSITTYINVLIKLRDYRQLTSLICNGELEMEGDFQVLKNFIALADFAEFDLAELLAPYIGDIAVESISKMFRSSSASFRKDTQQHLRYILDVVTEEWRMVPGTLEVAWFSEEMATIDRAVEAFSRRLKKLEDK